MLNLPHFLHVPSLLRELLLSFGLTFDPFNLLGVPIAKSFTKLERQTGQNAGRRCIYSGPLQNPNSHESPIYVINL